MVAKDGFGRDRQAQRGHHPCGIGAICCYPDRLEERMQAISHTGILFLPTSSVNLDRSFYFGWFRSTIDLLHLFATLTVNFRNMAHAHFW